MYSLQASLGLWAPIICWVGGHQLSVGLTQTCIASAVPRTKSSRLRREYMKGLKVVQCIKIDGFYIIMLCLWLLFALKFRKKTEPDHEKTFL